MPLIGISTNFLTVDKGKFIGMERIYVNKDYVDAIMRAGGTPILLPPVENRETIQQYVQLCDGFILSGGGDINPILYGATPHPRLEEIHSSLDRSQWILVEEILKNRKPLLAICRGMQLLNVVLGGTLWQDREAIDRPTLLHSQNAPRGDKFHVVDILPNSMLEKLFGNFAIVNSFHHQCLNAIGTGLRVTATAPDRMVEAIELSDYPFGMGLQWHPEMLLTQTDEMLRLFQAFVAASNK